MSPNTWVLIALAAGFATVALVVASRWMSAYRRQRRDAEREQRAQSEWADTIESRLMR